MEGLRCLMESIDGPRVVAVETNVEDAVGAVRELQPSILVVDKSLWRTHRDRLGAPAEHRGQHRPR